MLVQILFTYFIIFYMAFLYLCKYHFKGHFSINYQDLKHFVQMQIIYEALKQGKNNIALQPPS